MMSGLKTGVKEDRYEAVVLVEYCAAVAGIAQGGKVKIADVALQKKVSRRMYGGTVRTTRREGRSRRGLRMA